MNVVKMIDVSRFNRKMKSLTFYLVQKFLNCEVRLPRLL